MYCCAKFCMVVVFLLSLFVAFGTALAEERSTYLNINFNDIMNKSQTFSVAVFPVQNMSPDTEISVYFRDRIIEQLLSKGYSVIDKDALDKKLLEVGVQNKNQISLLELQGLVNLSSADAFLFGIIETGTEQHAVFYNGFAYTASLKLIYKDGETLWYNLSNRIAKRIFSIDPFNMVIDYALTDIDQFKRKAAFALADKIIKSLPDTNIARVYDNLLESAVEIGIK